MLKPFTLPQLSQRNRWLAGGAAVAALLLGSALLLRTVQEQAPLLLPAPPLNPDTPSPPKQQAWVSPLQRTCSKPGDTALIQRLHALRQQLPQRIETLTIDPSNYGQRYSRDAYGNPLRPQPSLVVLHETVYGIGSAINTFTTHHPDDADQVSYHVLIGEQGRIVQALDPAKRAYGAGYSAFRGRWVITNPAMAGSVNNFALHVSLETPLDGEDADLSHSGYTTAQYDALAVLLADWMQRYRIPFDHITTHRHVDLGLERADPRSFNWQQLQIRLAALGALC